MFTFLTPYLTYIKIGVIVILVATIGTLYVMVNHYKAENKVLTAQIQEAQLANAENIKTINSMKADNKRESSLCTNRLAEKDKIISNLRNLYSGGEVSHETTIISSGDTLLDALNSMSPKAGYKGGVCQAGSSSTASTGIGQSGDVLYCFSSKQDAINLVSNWILHKGREKDMEAILNSFQ